MPIDRPVSRRAFLLALAPAVASCVRPPHADPPAPRPVPPPADASPAPPAPLAMPAAITVDLTHDLVCPWCRIGHHNLRAALRDWTGPAVTVRYHPFLLNPDAPAEGVDLRQYLGARYGAGNIEAMFARVTAAGAQAGVRFDFAKIRRMADTTRGHAVFAHVPAEKQEAFLDALHTAHFEHGDEPGHRDVLLRVWRSVGLDEAAGLAAVDDTASLSTVRQQALAASRSGMGGVPHFEISGPSGRLAVHGAQPPEAFRAALHRVSTA